MAKAKEESAFSNAEIDGLIGGATTAAERDAILTRLKKRIFERMLAGELTHHLGYAPGADKPADQPNHRNGSTPKHAVAAALGPRPACLRVAARPPETPLHHECD
jgi:hypothetical protein